MRAGNGRMAGLSHQRNFLAAVLFLLFLLGYLFGKTLLIIVVNGVLLYVLFLRIRAELNAGWGSWYIVPGLLLVPLLVMTSTVTIILGFTLYVYAVWGLVTVARFIRGIFLQTLSSNY